MTHQQSARPLSLQHGGRAAGRTAKLNHIKTMSTYTVKVPPTPEVGSYSTTVSPSARETKAAAALSDYNSCRAHDGLPPLRRMPAGTTYERVYEYEVQGFTVTVKKNETPQHDR